MTAVTARLLFPIILLVGWASPAAAFEYSQPTKPYYAETVMSQRGRTVNVKTWYTPARVKMEVQMGARSMALIGDKAAKSMTMMLPGQKSYFVRPMPPELFGPLGKTGPGKDMKFEKVGEEEIAGVKATKYKATGKNAGGAAFTGHIWITADNIMVQLDGKQKRGERESDIKMTTKVLKVGPIDAKVFAIPEGYKKMGQ